MNIIVDIARQVLWLPIRQGSPDPRQWPTAVRLAMVLAAAAIVVGATTAISDIWLPGGRLIAMSNGTLLPDWSIPVLLWLAAVIWALAITGILHVHWLPKTVLTLFAVMSLAMMGLSPYPVSLAVTLLALVALIVVIVVRSFFKQHWLEFPIVLMLVSAVVFGPDLVAPLRAGEELRLLGLSGMLSATQVLTVPILIGAGLAYAQISVTLVQAVVQRSYRISRRIPALWYALFAVLIAVIVVQSIEGVRGGSDAWQPSTFVWSLGLVLIAATVYALVCRRRPVLDVESWSALTVPITAWMMVPMIVIVAVIQSSAVVLLFSVSATQQFLGVAGDIPVNLVQQVGRGLLGVALLVLFVRRSRRGEHNTTFVVLVAALFLVLGAVPSLSGRRVSGGLSPEAIGLIAAVAGLALFAWQLIRRRAERNQGLGLLLVLGLVALYPFRQALGEPMEVISGVATLGLLLPLLWRILTEGEWTRAGSRVFPLGSRVLLYAAYTLLAVTLVAYNALASTSSMLDPNTLQELGDFLLGTPLFVTALAFGLTQIATSGTGTAARQPVPTPVGSAPQVRQKV
ncbi:hypothetical protein [Granulicoccus phenolivorans]|uniref:hypothetical protein n=1 Tax=Granulicoccus phenolivorans TaxID=266854 RepID=UPI0004002D1A|nr:hypothetical protein [Granulicoccus phenolivorans]